MNAIPYNLQINNRESHPRNKSFCHLTTEFGDFDVKYKSYTKHNTPSYSRSVILNDYNDHNDNQLQPTESSQSNIYSNQQRSNHHNIKNN